MVRRPRSAREPHFPASDEDLIRQFYRTLERAWGRQHWWPAQSRFEVITGAYLTQNTAWANVERAISNLRRAGVLSIAGVRATPLEELEQLVRPAGYFRQKAQRLKTFVEYLDTNYAGSMQRMFARPTAELRQELLALNGVGPETSDSILLYAGDHEIFVVDAYTRRIVERHGILPSTADYDDIRQLFERALEGIVASMPAGTTENQVPSLSSGQALGSTQDDNVGETSSRCRGAAHQPSRRSSASRSELAQVFNQMHALIVGVGKNFCSSRNPDCAHCPLRAFLPEDSPFKRAN